MSEVQSANMPLYSVDSSSPFSAMWSNGLSVAMIVSAISVLAALAWSTNIQRDGAHNQPAPIDFVTEALSRCPAIAQEIAARDKPITNGELRAALLSVTCQTSAAGLGAGSRRLN